LISSESPTQSTIRLCSHALALGLAVLAPASLAAQGSIGLQPPQASGPTASSYQGSIAGAEVSSQTIDLSLDDAIQRGLKTNLGIILSGTQSASARGHVLSELQSLLPSVDATGKETRLTCQRKACAFRAFPPSSGHLDLPTSAPPSIGR